MNKICWNGNDTLIPLPNNGTRRLSGDDDDDCRDDDDGEQHHEDNGDDCDQDEYDDSRGDDDCITFSYQGYASLLLTNVQFKSKNCIRHYMTNTCARFRNDDKFVKHSKIVFRFNFENLKCSL